jgi:hypothetical protein
MELIKGDVARSESHTWKDKDEIFIEMAAEQFARLLWKQCFCNEKLDKSGAKHKNREKEDVFSNRMS